jgi:threonine dehydrogenase-like Zn-dependent dehydrogenase
MEAGSPHAINTAIHATRKGGIISIIGVYGPPFNLVDIGTFMNKAQRMNTGQASVKRYMPHLLEHIRSGRVDAKGIISHRLPLEDAPHAYEIFQRKEDGAIKIVLEP